MEYNNYDLSDRMGKAKRPSKLEVSRYARIFVTYAITYLVGPGDWLSKAWEQDKLFLTPAQFNSNSVVQKSKLY